MWTGIKSMERIWVSAAVSAESMLLFRQETPRFSPLWLKGTRIHFIMRRNAEVNISISRPS